MPEEDKKPENDRQRHFDQEAFAARIKTGLPPLGGLGFLYLSAFGGYIYWREVSRREINTIGDYALVFVGAFVVVSLFYFSFKLILSVLAEKKDVIPERDRALLEPLISNANEKAIEQYIRLSSLSGATGTATRLGLTGLPLLTVALTLIFSAIAIFDKTNSFMDLAKLTLGAFIGSFVQRTATEQSIASKNTEFKSKDVL